jgi:hypothetical protein
MTPSPCIVLALLGVVRDSLTIPSASRSTESEHYGQGSGASEGSGCLEQTLTHLSFVLYMRIKMAPSPCVFLALLGVVRDSLMISWASKSTEESSKQGSRKWG